MSILDHHPWYSLSLPGHYPAALPSDFRTEELSADMMAEVLLVAIRQLVGERPVALVGHSTGGFAALNIAAHKPEIALGVFSISGFAHGKWTGVLGLLQKFARLGRGGRLVFKMMLKAVVSSRAIYRRSFAFYANDRRAIFEHPELDTFLARNYPDARALDLDAMFHYFNRMPDIDISPLLPRITAPTLALAGDHDPIVPPAQTRLIAERVPNAQLMLFEGVGHLPTSERSGAYQRLLTDWIKRVTS